MALLPTDRGPARLAPVHHWVLRRPRGRAVGTGPSTACGERLAVPFLSSLLFFQFPKRSWPESTGWVSRRGFSAPSRTHGAHPLARPDVRSV